MYKKRLQVEVLLSTFVKVLHWMYDLFFLFFSNTIAVLLFL